MWLTKLLPHVCQYFDKNVTSVKGQPGLGTGIFFIDEALFMARPDLILTGRTLWGIHHRKTSSWMTTIFLPYQPVNRFMQDVENEAYKLGIPVKPVIMRWRQTSLSLRPFMKKPTWPTTITS
jgi:glutamine synthetase